MKYYLTDLTREEKKELQDKGYNVYDLRLADNGSEIATIENSVWVNNCGNIITSEKLEIDDFIDYYDFCSNNDLVEDLAEIG